MIRVNEFFRNKEEIQLSNWEKKRNGRAWDLFVALARKTFYSFVIRATTIDIETMQTGHFLLR